MTLVVATDEAGYGPKLGPLVIVASAWQKEGQQKKGQEPFLSNKHQGSEKAPDPFLASFEAAVAARKTTSGKTLTLADSKKLFQRSAGSLSALEKPIVAWMADLNLPSFPQTLGELLSNFSAQDCASLFEKPWFADLSSPFPSDTKFTNNEQPSLVPDGPVRLVGLAMRVIDAREFNQLSNDCGNKATLLSEATVGLAKELIEAHLRYNQVSDEYAYVFSDRHGGRQKYAGLLQQFFPDDIPTTVEETKHCSRYRLSCDHQPLDWRFSVKGDSFAPVAFSSMVAKYVRERMMEHFNAYWLGQHSGELRPTAGYPVDAERFCDAIAPTAKRLGVAEEHYIRCR